METSDTFDAACAVLESRCEAIDLHYRRFPNTVERTMEETAAAMRIVVEEARSLRARHSTILADECGACVLTRAACADAIAEIEVLRLAA